MPLTPDPGTSSQSGGPVRPETPRQSEGEVPSDRRRGPSRHLARLARSLAGALLLVAGAVMLVLPGPGLLAIVAGLTLFAVDYAWARRLLVAARRRLDTAGRSVAHRVRGSQD